MASAIIHICVANEINKQIKMDNDLLLLGSIAPDLAKLIGDTKEKGHFLYNNNSGQPNITKFLDKYSINKPFEMGYYIHLYTDLFWFRDLIPKHYKNKLLYLNNGNSLNIPFSERLKLIYNDYSSLNKLLKSEYNLNLSFLNKEYQITTSINELDFSKINVLVNETKKIIEESITYPLNVFSNEEIINFIEYCKEYILKEVYNEQVNISK